MMNATQIATKSPARAAGTRMVSQPSRPTALPSLIPFVVMAAALVLIYVGLLVFPTIKTIINQQDCVASGRSDCYPRP